MIIAVLAVLGLVWGSFVNALVWRIHEQDEKHKKGKDLSILHGRSMCPQCKHRLTTRDLIPLLSWMSLRGKCRYCGRRISVQYPLVEASTVFLFVASYIWWPVEIAGLQVAVFVLWLLISVGLVALVVYDYLWLLLPNRLVYPLTAIAGLMAILGVVSSDEPLIAIARLIGAVAVGGGLFYLLFQLSKGAWIGGGDVKLGWMLGLIAGSPAKSFLFIFIAATLGSLLSLPLLLSQKLKRTSLIPFGPFLIVGAIIVQLFGSNILDWYSQTFLNL